MDNIVISVMEKIRDECKARKGCKGCPYSIPINDAYRQCIFTYGNPDRWQLEKLEDENNGC